MSNRVLMAVIAGAACVLWSSATAMAGSPPRRPPPARTPPPAAAPSWHHGHWHHGWYGSRLGWWWVVGPRWYFYPVPVDPYWYPYPRERVTVEEQPEPSGPPPIAYWYWCDEPNGYYPYVGQCPGGWKPVPATPADAKPATPAEAPEAP